jgi:hypothetical protein
VTGVTMDSGGVDVDRIFVTVLQLNIIKLRKIRLIVILLSIDQLLMGFGFYCAGFRTLPTNRI